MIEKLQPRRAFLTHLSHSFDYQAVSATLPPNVQLAHDGLRVTWSGMKTNLITDISSMDPEIKNHAENNPSTVA